VVSDVLADEPVELEPLSLPVPHAPGLTAFEGRRFDPRLEGAARIYPHHLDSGGLFLARLRRLVGGGTGGGRVASEADAGAWSPVPPVFPGDGMESAEAETLVARALEALDDHFGVGAGVFGGMGWTARGGRLWLHSLARWPLEAWEPGRWRPLSVGFRAVEFDTRGRSRPTNDLLQWLGRAVVRGAVDLETSELVALLDGGAVERAEELYGLLALRWSGAVVGRGVATSAGVRSEVPRARAADLRSVITGKGSVTPTPDDD